MGFYTNTGAYGINKSKAASIFSLGQNFGGGQQFVQDTSNGLFFIGTTTCTSGCEMVLFFNGRGGGFRSGSLTNSEEILASGGVATGLAVDSTYNYLFVADAAHNTVYSIDASVGSIMTGPTLAPTGTGANYLGYDSYLKRLLVAETTLGTVWALSEPGNMPLATSPAQLTITSGACAANNISYIAVNSPEHYAYVLCGNAVVYLRTYNSPTYAGGSVGASTFTATGLTTATDIINDTVNGTVVLSGQNFVVSMDAMTGATGTTMDLTSGNCGFASLDLEALAYSSSSNTIYVADAANNMIYLLDGGTLNFKNGTCTNSSFATPDVPGPVRLSFF